MSHGQNNKSLNLQEENTCHVSKWENILDHKGESSSSCFDFKLDDEKQTQNSSVLLCFGCTQRMLTFGVHVFTYFIFNRHEVHNYLHLLNQLNDQCPYPGTEHAG